MAPVDATKKKESELILSVASDPFYRENMNKNFGELGIALKELVAEFKKKTKSVIIRHIAVFEGFGLSASNFSHDRTKASTR